MSYPHFFINKNAVNGNQISITDAEFRHLIRVLRADIGDRVVVSDNKDTRYESVIENIGRNHASLKIVSYKHIAPKKPMVILYLCILKKTAMEIAIQKSTEIGVDNIIPVFSNRVVIEIAGKKRKERLSRWQQIAFNASKQCKRNFICGISEPLDIDSIEPGTYDGFFLPYEGLSHKKGENPFLSLMAFFDGKKIENLDKIAFIIGPEGGFEDSEIDKLVKKGAIKINFGANILRSETACIYFTSIIDFILKVLDEKNII